MRYTSGPSFGATSGGFQTTRWVKCLLLANAGLFLVTAAVGIDAMADLFAFSPSRLLERPWGILTYMFVHAGLWHLLMNLLVLFFFGPPLESRWGSDFFIKFYLACGFGGVLLSFFFADAAIVGASAACYGVMLAFAMTWPDAPIHIWGVVPVRAKWVVGFLAALSFASAVGPGRDGIAHLAHLGGVVTGFLVVKSGRAPVLWGDAGGAAEPRSGGRGGGSGGSSGDAGWAARLRRWKGRGGSRPAASAQPGLRSRYDALTLRIAALLDRKGAGARNEAGRASPARPSPKAAAGPRREAKRRDAADDSATTNGRRTVHARARRVEVRAIPMPPVRERRRTAAEERAELDALDAVLDKISASGMKSLTDDEKDLLDRVSRRERTN